MKKKIYLILGIIFIVSLISYISYTFFYKSNNLNIIQTENEVETSSQEKTTINEQLLLDKLILRNKLDEMGVGSIVEIKEGELTYRYYNDSSLLIYDGTNYYVKNVKTGKIENYTLPKLENVERRSKTTLNFDDIKDTIPTRHIHTVKFNLKEVGENILSLFDYITKVGNDFINTIQNVSIYEYNDKIIAYVENRGDYIFYMENGKYELTDLTFEEFKNIISQFKKEEVKNETTNEIKDPYGRTQSYPKGVTP